MNDRFFVRVSIRFILEVLLLLLYSSILQGRVFLTVLHCMCMSHRTTLTNDSLSVARICHLGEWCVL